MPAIQAKSKKDARRRLIKRFGKEAVKLSTLRYMKSASQFQKKEYGKKLKWYRANYK